MNTPPNKHKPIDEKGYLGSNLEIINPKLERLWDKAVLIVAILLVSLGFYLYK